jgi:DNA-binding beta-propeller fold protein YncE
MSIMVVNNQERLKKAFTDFDNKKLRRILVIILLLLLFLFLYLYTNNIDLSKGPGQNISLLAGKPKFLYTIYGTEQEPLRKPMGVLELDHKIYVSDTDNHRLQVFDYEGNPMQIIGKRGKGKGEFEYPFGLAVDSNKQIYVADIQNNNISVLSSSGHFIKYFGNRNDIKKPAGLYIDNNKVYVSDIGLNKVLVFDLDGKKLSEIGKLGTEPGQLRSPNAVVVAKGKIYVSDSGNDRVQIFNQMGQYIGILDGAERPGGKSNLLAPRGVSVDGRGTVFVVNNLFNTVNGYDQSNKKIFAFGSMGNDPEQFYLPSGIWVDGRGRIYVTDTVNQRVDVYQN